MSASRILPFALSSLLLVGAGCITISGGGAGTATGSDGGVFKTANKGDAWAQSNAIATTDGSPRGIAAINSVTLAQDPSDPKAFYLGTVENGLFVSYDSGASWEQNPQMARGRVPSVSVDAKDKCTVYAAKDNTVVKTSDCSRTWAVAYLDTRQNASVGAVAVDFYDSRIVWAGNSSGDLLQSKDGGVSWTVVNTFKASVQRIVLHPSDSRIVYAATKNAGIWRSRDAGTTWTDLSENYKTFEGAKEFYDLSYGVTAPNTIVLASKYGLIRTDDAGDTWKAIDLLTPPGSTVIYSVAVDPRDPANIYYGTSTQFYRSANGGVNWVPKKLPTPRAATVLHVDRADSNVLYMGVTRFK